MNAKLSKLPLFAICAASDIAVSCEINSLSSFHERKLSFLTLIYSMRAARVTRAEEAWF